MVVTKNISKKLPNFGINVVLKNIDNSTCDTLIERLNELRVSWIRLEFDFNFPNSINNYEYFLKKCFENNINVLGLLASIPPGTLLNVFYPERKYLPVLQIKTAYLEFVKNVVKKYSKYINHWEIWNEPNLRRFWPGGPNPKEYHTLLSEASSLIKTMDKNAKVVFGGICGNEVDSMIYGHKTHFFTDYAKEFGDGNFDIVAFHPYFTDCYFSLHNFEWFKNKMTENFKIITSTVKEFSKKPIWFNEFGISPRWVHLSQKEIAELYVWYYKLCAKNDITLFIWQLSDTKDFSYEFATPENYFGLLDDNLKPKPVYDVLVNKVNW